MRAKVRTEKRRKWLARRTRTLRAAHGAKHPRIDVYRSARHIYAQIVDPATGRTLAGVSSRTAGVVGTGATGNREAAAAVGRALAAKASELKIEQVVFNRNGFLYHGRVKALADAARDAGLRF